MAQLVQLVPPPSNIPIIINPFGTTPSVNPIPFNQFTGGAYGTTTFDQGFATLGAAAFYILYDESQDNVPVPFQTSLNGANIWVTGKVGYHIIPGFYLFAEGDGIFQRFNNSLFDTNGYRVIGGMGWDDPKSLFRGEIYGGYQAQFQENANGVSIPPGLGIPSTTTTSPVFGGRISYYPTPYWTLIAQVDETLGVSTFLSPTIPAGAPSLVTTALLQTTYGIARDWSVGVRGGYTRAQFFGHLRCAEWLARRRLFQLRDMAEFAADARLPIHDHEVECDGPEFCDQLGYCWCYVQILRMVLMAGWKRD